MSAKVIGFFSLNLLNNWEPMLLGASATSMGYKNGECKQDNNNRYGTCPSKINACNQPCVVAIFFAHSCLSMSFAYNGSFVRSEDNIMFFYYLYLLNLKS